MRAVSWITVLMLAVMLYMVAGTLTRSEGVVFALPDEGAGDSETSRLVAVLSPQKHDTLVFFDDVRYILDDDAQMAQLGAQLAQGASRTGEKAILVLADTRVPLGDAMRFAKIVKSSGIERMLFANKRQEEAD